MKPILNFGLRLLLTAIVSWLAGLLVIAGVLYFSNGGADFSVPDILGFGGLVVVGSGLVMILWYLPTLFWLRRSKAISRPWVFPLASGVLLNLPIFLALFWLIGRKMAAGEAVLFMLAFLVIGSIFGGGFLWGARCLRTRAASVG
jgi:hypothetical protein